MIPGLFLTLAEELAQAGGAAECRTAISRAYYAVFNSWKNMRAAIAKANITGTDNLVDLSGTP